MSSRPETSRDASDLQVLIRSHQASVWRYLRFLGCDSGEADDLTQETFLAVVGRPVARFGHGGARAYLRTVARNFYLRMRAQGLEQPVSIDGGLEIAESAFDWVVAGEDEGAEIRSALRACLGELPSKGREALDLRYRDGLDRTAIAQRLNMSPHGIKSLLQRSYARLRVCVQRRVRHES